MEKVSTHTSSKIRLLIALLLALIYFVILTAGSCFTESLALQANAGHMLMHSSVLFIALIATILSEKKANEKFTAGYARIESLGAFINGIILLIVSISIGVEALEHHHSHDGHNHSIDTSLMGIIAGIGLILHIVAAFILYKGRQESLNVHAVFLHVFLDVIITLSTLTVAIAMHLGAPDEIDRLLALAISVFVTFSALKLLRASAIQLLDGLPKDINQKEIIKALQEMDHITDVHNVIIRRQGTQTSLSAHLVLKSECIHSDHWVECRKEAEELLKVKFGIGYSVLQMEVSEKHAEKCDHPSHS